ncbi:MAG: glycosyltransferase family 39 protein [Candidatus Omnitrophota bacterium]
MNPIKKKWEIIVLTVIIAIGAGFRFTRLDEKGYIFPDERCYNFAGRSLVQEIKSLDAKVDISSLERREKVEKIVKIIGAINQFYAKPTHTILSAIGLQVFSGKECGDLYLFALLGTLTILLIYLISRPLWGAPAALLSCLYLALSPWHINYSRSALAQGTSLFFLTLALYFYINSLRFTARRKFELSLSGLLLGLGFTCHYLVGIFLVIFVINELVLKMKKRSSFAALGLLLGFTLVPLFFFELLYMVGKIYTGDKILTYSNSYFLASILQFLAGTSYGGYHLSDPTNGWILPLKLWTLSEGYFVWVFIIGAIIYLALNLKKERPWVHSFLLLGILFPYLFWAIVSSYGLVARVYSPLIPVLAIGIGIAAAKMVEMLKLLKFKAITAMILGSTLSLLFFSSLILSAQKCLSYNSPYVAIERYLKANGVKTVATIGRWFFFENLENIPARSWSEVLRLYQEGKIRFFINDYMAMDPQVLNDFLAINKGEVLSVPSAFNYIFYQYEGVPEQIRRIWQNNLPLEVKLIDVAKYLEAAKK